MSYFTQVLSPESSVCISIALKMHKTKLWTNLSNLSSFHPRNKHIKFIQCEQSFFWSTAKLDGGFAFKTLFSVALCPVQTVFCLWQERRSLSARNVPSVSCGATTWRSTLKLTRTKKAWTLAAPWWPRWNPLGPQTASSPRRAGPPSSSPTSSRDPATPRTSWPTQRSRCSSSPR